MMRLVFGMQTKTEVLVASLGLAGALMSSLHLD